MDDNIFNHLSLDEDEIFEFPSKAKLNRASVDLKMQLNDNLKLTTDKTGQHLDNDYSDHTMDLDHGHNKIIKMSNVTNDHIA